MPRLLFVYLSKRIAIGAAVIAAGLCVPVVMTSLFHLAAGRHPWRAACRPFLARLPTVLYIALPMAVGVAVALEFSRMSADGMIAVLYSLRLSVWSICFRLRSSPLSRSASVIGSPRFSRRPMSARCTT